MQDKQFRFKPPQVYHKDYAAAHIRSRYLYRLGMAEELQGVTFQIPTIQSTTVQSLKNDNGETDTSISVHSPPLRACSWLLCPATKSVCFESSVVVHCIPNKRHYSEGIKRNIWLQPDEINKATKRSPPEKPESQPVGGWDWRQAYVHVM